MRTDEDRREDSSVFFPAATLGLTSPCYTSASPLARAGTLLSLLFFSCPSTNDPGSLSPPPRPTGVPLFLPFILQPQVSFHLASQHPGSPPSTPFTSVLAICGPILSSHIVLCCRQRHSGHIQLGQNTKSDFSSSKPSENTE